jgi:SMC interacting uncharacterized protein involved in chromosome segregation
MQAVAGQHFSTNYALFLISIIKSARLLFKETSEGSVMEKAQLQREVAEIDSKLRELEVETADHARDVAQRLKSLRDHVAEFQSGASS